MTFEAQERALFELLFDAGLRAEFEKDRGRALARFDLTPGERADFESVRLDGLRIDAALRCDLMLQHLCRALPVTFSLLSSLPGGLAHARAQIDPALARARPGDRSALLGRALRDFFDVQPFRNADERASGLALCDAELGMALTAGALRQARGQPDASLSGPRDPSWRRQPLRLAPHVAAALLPQSYAAAKRALCPVPDAELWARLCSAPLPAPRRTQTLGQRAPRLFVTRAYVAHSSLAEVTVHHRMVELSAGFLPLLQHLDGTQHVASLLAGLQQAGAGPGVCQGVEAGFAKLLDEGMLCHAHAHAEPSAPPAIH